MFRWFTYPWRKLRQADLVAQLQRENSGLRVRCALLADREQNLKANLAMALSEANRLQSLATQTAQSNKPQRR